MLYGKTTLERLSAAIVSLPDVRDELLEDFTRHKHESKNQAAEINHDLRVGAISLEQGLEKAVMLFEHISDNTRCLYENMLTIDMEEDKLRNQLFRLLSSV